MRVDASNSRQRTIKRLIVQWAHQGEHTDQHQRRVRSDEIDNQKNPRARLTETAQQEDAERDQHEHRTGQYAAAKRTVEMRAHNRRSSAALRRPQIGEHRERETGQDQ